MLNLVQCELSRRRYFLAASKYKRLSKGHVNGLNILKHKSISIQKTLKIS